MRDRSCERAREGVSLRLDGELSELEGVLLQAHLSRCAGCRTFAAQIEAGTSELRAAPLEVPEYPVVVSRRRRVAPFRLRQATAAAAAVVVAAGVAGLTESLRSQQRTAATPALQQFSTYSDVAEWRVLRRGEMQGNVVLPTRDMMLPGDN